MKRLEPKVDPKRLEVATKLQAVKEKRAGGKLSLEDIDDKLDLILELIQK